MKIDPEFKTEAELCSYFIEAVEKEWTAYPETAGWDILLVRKDDGFQIGIEAKLRLNAKVLTQTLEEIHWDWIEDGPDCRAVLVPYDCGGDFGLIAEHLAITIIRARRDTWRGSKFVPALPKAKEDHYRNRHWFEMLPTRRHTLPDYIPDVAAGASAPLKLTDWKVRAIKIAVLLDRGPIQRADFKALKIDIRRWIDNGWIVPTAGGFVRGDGCPDLKAQHPRNYEEIAADFENWKPAEVAS